MVENPNGRPKLFLTNIHPFTSRQAEIITKILENKSYQETAQELGIRYQTVKNIIYGGYVWKYKGIWGRIDEITGKRPRSRTELVTILLGDIVLFSEPPRNEP